VEAVSAESLKESAPKLCGDSSHRIYKRICPKTLWRQFPPNLKKISKRICPKILWMQFPPNLKKNPPKKESTPKFCENSSHRISRRIPPKKFAETVPAESQICLKWNLPQNYVEAVPTKNYKEAALTESQKESAPKITLRQFLLNLKKNLPQNYVEAVATKS
jgi:hypothetical protein